MIKIYVPALAQKSYEFRRGDAQIIHDTKGNAIVIDGGEPDLCRQLFTYCKANGITHVTMVLTHWHYDHRIGLQQFLDVSGIIVDKIYCPPAEELKDLTEDDVKSDYNAAKRILNTAASLHKTVIYPAADKTTLITVGEIRCELWRRRANRNDYRDYQVNNTSIQAYFPDLYYLTGGDIINAFSGYLEKLHKTVKVFKIPHHGNACTTDPCKLLKDLGAELCWYNDFEPKGVSVGGTGFSHYGAGYCKKYFTTLPTHTPINISVSNGKFVFKQGNSTYTFAVPFAAGEWVIDKNGKRYLLDGKYIKDKPFCIDGKWYYFDEKGYLKHGWIKPDESYRYMDPVTGAMVTNAWKTINGKTYYFDGYGRRIENKFYKIADKWYSFGKNGAMQTGFIKAPDNLYRYCNPYMYVNKWATVDGKKYYFDEWGKRIENKPENINGKWYFFDKNGVMRTGWYTESGVGKHYLDPETGAMYVNREAMIDGKNYKFDGYGRIV